MKISSRTSTDSSPRREGVYYHHAPDTAALDQCDQQWRLRAHGLADRKRVQLAHACATEPAHPLGTGPDPGRLGEIHLPPRQKGDVWSAGWKPVCVEPEYYDAATASATPSSSQEPRHRERAAVFVPNDAAAGGLATRRSRNTTRRPRQLALSTYLEWCLGRLPTGTGNSTGPSSRRRTTRSRMPSWRRSGSGKSRRTAGTGTPTGTTWRSTASSLKPSSFDADKETFLGRYGSPAHPAAADRPDSGTENGQLA